MVSHMIPVIPHGTIFYICSSSDFIGDQSPLQASILFHTCKIDCSIVIDSISGCQEKVSICHRKRTIIFYRFSWSLFNPCFFTYYSTFSTLCNVDTYRTAFVKFRVLNIYFYSLSGFDPNITVLN